MRAKLISVLVLVLAAWVGWANVPSAFVGAGPANSGVGSELITLTSPLGDFGQQLIVIDPKLRSLSVYHVSAATGELSLKSARNFHWDLQFSHFNNVGPTPQEIRSLIEQPSLGR